MKLRTRYKGGFFIDRMNTNMKLQKILFAILIFTIPSNLFKVFFESSAFVNGLKVDYLIPKLFLSDIAVAALLFSLILSAKNRTIVKNTINRVPNKLLPLLLLFILTMFQIGSLHPIISIMFLVRVFALILTILIIKEEDFLNSKIASVAIKATLIFQSLLAWFQYLNQKSFFGYLFFGETNLNSYAGIARSSVFGPEKILPYGTTAHPNILGGVLAIFTLIHLNHLIAGSKKYQKINSVILLLSVSAILITQSISAFLAVIIGSVIIYLKKNHKFTLTLNKYFALFIATNIFVIVLLSGKILPINVNNISIFRRSYLNDAAFNMITDNFFTGVGLQNFTALAEKYSESDEIVRFVQPVHNLVLLLLSETGVLGLAVLLIFILPALKKKQIIKNPEYLLAIIPIAVLDHYLLTVQSGLLLLTLIVL